MARTAATNEAKAAVQPMAVSPTSLVVANTDGQGVYIRRTPAMSDRIKVWPDRTVMAVVGSDADGDGEHWRNVKDPDGNVGWVPSKYLDVAPTPRPASAPTPDARPSEVDAGIPVPSNAVAQTGWQDPSIAKYMKPGSSQKYRVPGSSVKDLLAFYQRTLPADGWSIDTKDSDFEGKSPGTGGTRIIFVCRGPAIWRSVLFNDEAEGTVLFVSTTPVTDPCE